ncbi:hypothetical protein EDD18DRAFT_1100625 [Armillaria luteobubalina]|uniref:DUF155 domain-containing protein n=1 Tax=Armillaria luteobubalina TaxID=153913 RepID=A0AA39QFV4_9AGAR|nr:hypothetical protein EDD18DRAFT_1100625 [Armillaria luteobubalina]
MESLNGRCPACHVMDHDESQPNPTSYLERVSFSVMEQELERLPKNSSLLLQPTGISSAYWAFYQGWRGRQVESDVRVMDDLCGILYKISGDPTFCDVSEAPILDLYSLPYSGPSTWLYTSGQQQTLPTSKSGGPKDREGEVFVFTNSSFICWGLDKQDARTFASEVLHHVPGIEISPLKEAETEELEFVTDPTETTRLQSDLIILRQTSTPPTSSDLPSMVFPSETVLSRYTFSQALSHSTAPSALEVLLDKYLSLMALLPHSLVKWLSSMNEVRMHMKLGYEQQTAMMLTSHNKLGVHPAEKHRGEAYINKGKGAPTFISSINSYSATARYCCASGKCGKPDLISISVRLQKRDSFFSDPQQTHICSASKADPFPANVLLEVERRYGVRLAQEGIDKLSILTPDTTTPFGGIMQQDGWPSQWRWRQLTRGGSFLMDRLSGTIGWLQAKDFFELADHVEAGISWEGLTTGVETLSRPSTPSTPSYPALSPALNHPADNLVTRGYTIII